MSYQQEKFTEIADKLREKLGTRELIKPLDFAKKIDEAEDKTQINAYTYILQNGKDLTNAVSESGGYKSGGDAIEWYWNKFLGSGNRTDFRGMKSSQPILNSFGGWANSEVIIPDRLVMPTMAYGMFYKCPKLKKVLNVNFSNATNITALFQYCEKLEKVGRVETDLALSSGFMFGYCYNLEEIEYINIPNSIDYTGAFNDCVNLKKVTFAPESIKGNISFTFSEQMSKESIISVINGLSSKASGKTATLNLYAVNRHFTNAEWKALIATKSNWSIGVSYM